MRLRNRGILAGVAAVAVALSAAVTAHGEPTTAAVIPALQGPECDALKAEIGADTTPTVLTTLAGQSASANIAAVPSLSTFNSAITGGLNPAVDTVSVLDNGPYTVFAPTDDAFAKLDPAALATLRTDPAKLYSVVYYHMVLSILGVDDVHGTLTTQQGAQVTVEGTGGNITVNGARVLCGAVTGASSRIYLIDTVLDPTEALSADQTTASPTTTAPESAAVSTTPAPDSTTDPADTASTTPVATPHVGSPVPVGPVPGPPSA